MTESSTPATATDAPAATTIDPLSAAIEKPATADTAATTETATATTDTSAATDSDPAASDTATESTEVTAYEEFKVPEGQEINPDIMDEFKSAALDAKLTQEQAQHLIDMGAKMTEQLTQKAWEAHNARVAEWGEQSKADKEFGGDKLNENLALASKAMDAFATPELKQVLDQTGIGNHPELIRAFVRIGRQISEDRLVPGGSMPAGDSRSIAERLYPNS